jgi:hypothetical protein
LERLLKCCVAARVQRLTQLQMYQENPEKDFFDEVMDLIGADSKDSAAAAVRHTLHCFPHTRDTLHTRHTLHTRYTLTAHVAELRRRRVSCMCKAKLYV